MTAHIITCTSRARRSGWASSAPARWKRSAAGCICLLYTSTEGAWAPWTYHDENDQLVGFDVEVAQGVAAKLGVTAKFVETEWDGIFAGLDAGRYDMAANGVEVTDERDEV